MTFIKNHLNALLFVLGLIAISLTLFNFRARTLNTVQNDAVITMRAEQGMVLVPGNCVLISWEVSNIQTIFINDEPTTGNGQQALCIDSATQPTLDITFQDGTSQVISLPVPVLIWQPLLWIGLVLWGLCLYRVVRAWRVKPERVGAYKFARTTFLVLLNIVLPLLVIEFGLRWYFSNHGTEEDLIMYIYSAEEIRALDNVLVPMSYMNYAPSPYFPEHNSMGYRGDEIALPKPPDVYRIVALGGSTTYSTGTTPENAYPALLERILHEEYGYTHVEVINGGFIGYSTWETLTHLAFRVLELEPNMLIHYAAVNDLVPREQISTDCYRGQNILRGVNAARGFWMAQQTELSWSTVYRFVAINLGWMPNPLGLRSNFELPNGNCQNDGGLSLSDRVMLNEPVYFERNLRSLVGIAQVHEIDIMFSTWAYYADTERPDYWEAAIAQHNDITQVVGDDLDISVIDLAVTFPVNSDFWEPDGVHMVASGTAEQARQYAQFLVENNLIPDGE